jgi:glycosyltransferase involved in cell wall biosynthesis
MTASRIAVVIPALDEERSIEAVVASIDRVLVAQIVVGDNGSGDRTAELARAAGATVVVERDRGYGAACAAALSRIDPATDIVVFMDADGSDDPAEMRALVTPIVEGRAELVIGSRVLGNVEPGAMTLPQRFGNRLATRLIEIVYRHRYTDLGPYRAVRKTLLDAIAMRDRRFGWTVEMQVRALQLGARVVEVPASYRRRIGRSKISGTISGVATAGFWILFTIARCWRQRQRGEMDVFVVR